MTNDYEPMPDGGSPVRSARPARWVARAAAGVMAVVIALWGGIRLLNNETLYRRLSDVAVLGGYREAGLYGVQIKGVTYPPQDSATVAAIAWDKRWCFGHTRLTSSRKTLGWFILDLDSGELRVIGDGAEFERQMRELSGLTTADMVLPGSVWSWREWAWR